MSEIKPQKDDSQAGQKAPDGSRGAKSGDSPKPHGDKLQHAVDEASEPSKKR
jgi:hypothetical protein